MLSHASSGIEYLFDRQAVSPGLIGRVIACWDDAAFSDAADASLRRYFSCQLRRYAEVAGQLAEMGALGEELILKPIDHLCQYHPVFFDTACPAPEVYRARVIRRAVARPDPCLSGPAAESILNYIREVSGPAPASCFSYRALDYFERLVSAVNTANSGNDLLNEMLILNFNHIGFLAGVQQELRNDLAAADPGTRCGLLQARLAFINAAPENIGNTYDPCFPNLKTMLAGWLAEQLGSLPGPGLAQTVPKLKLKLPASEIACLVYCSHSLDWYGDTSLTTLFNFIAGHCSSKSKMDLSCKNLSKEYYSITQKTAAVTRGHLQEMIAVLNKRFFPA